MALVLIRISSYVCLGHTLYLSVYIGFHDGKDDVCICCYASQLLLSAYSSKGIQFTKFNRLPSESLCTQSFVNIYLSSFIQRNKSSTNYK